MRSMIRLSKSASGDDFVLILAGQKWLRAQILLSVEEAADLYVQIGALLPPDKKNVALFSSDRFDEESK